MNNLISTETADIVMLVVLIAFAVVMVVVSVVLGKKNGATADNFSPADPVKVRKAMNYLVPILFMLACVLSLVEMILIFTHKYSAYIEGGYKACTVITLLLLVGGFAAYYMARKKEGCYFVSLGALFVSVITSWFLPWDYEEATFYLTYILGAILPVLVLSVAVHYFVSSKVQGEPSPLTARLAGVVASKGRTVLRVVAILAMLLALVNGILLLVKYTIDTVSTFFGIILPIVLLFLAVVVLFMKNKKAEDGALGYRKNYRLGAIYVTIAAMFSVGFGYSIYYLGLISQIIMIPAILLFIACYYVLPWQEDAAAGAATTAGVPDTGAMLADLEALYSSGIITKAEYEAEKEKLLLK